jgi:hypothetical protein
MATITLKINERTKAGKAFMALVDLFSSENKGIEIIEKSEDSPYNPEFVEKVLNSHKNDKRVTIESGKLWDSI